MHRLAIACVLILASLSPLVAATDQSRAGDSKSRSDSGLTSSLGAPIEYGDESPIFSQFSPSVRAAFARVSDLSQYNDSELTSAHQWVAVSAIPLGEEAVHLPDTWIVELDRDGGSGASLFDGVTSLNAPSHFAKLQAVGIVEVAYPLVEKEVEPRLIPNDTKFSDQWHLRNTGQTSGLAGEDANVTGVWNTYNGSGVVIGIVDDGLDWDHPDLDDYYESSLDYDYCGNDGNPNPSNWDAHGTAAAGVAAAVGNNSLGVSGAAPAAGLAGIRLISCSLTDTKEANAISHERQSIDIYSNSWGPSDNGRTLEAPGPLTLAVFESDAYLGRGGYGNLITWAAGNGLANGDDGNMDGYANSRFTIAVAAITHQGEQSWYSEPGANILVTTQSDGDGEGITTTDIEGSSGYTSSDYTDNFGGTSSATPLVSGVLALLLDANQNLTWRDVQHILVNSGRKNDPTDSSWWTNGAGREVSHKYGFGALDAGAAITLAENWTTVGPEMNVTGGLFNPAVTIPDNTGVAVEETVNITQDLLLESVEVFVDISHDARGDLDVKLISPSGYISTLAKEHSDQNNDYANWVFSSTHFWDEGSRGTWTLKVEDTYGGTTGTLDSWELILHGTELHRDSDGDGLLDDDEIGTYGTDPDDEDSDDDFLLDGYEVFNSTTDPLNPDSDYDGLLDGVEVLVNGTDPLNNDTDGDGMLDGYEVYTSFSDPLFYDEDDDNDGWYWFEDCVDNDPQIFPGAYENLDNQDNDCDGYIDEGFNESDLDNDGLSDWLEYHFYNTGWYFWDTDGDGLSDGDEVLNWSSDPLFFDNDTDQDGWYWFADCDDTNASLFPGNPELLDGVDNDCDDDVDEDFYGLDTDEDGLFDLDEYNIIGTDPFHNDTDRDGLLDGEELLVTHTDPLSPDLDEDGDGFRWFDDCDDNDSARAPDANETWNWIDDDCDGDIDNGVNRSAHYFFEPDEAGGVMTGNLTHMQIDMDFWLANVSFGVDELVENTEISWTLVWPDSQVTELYWGTVARSVNDHNGIRFEEGVNVTIPSIDCSEPLAYNLMEQTLCPRHNETVDGWVLTFEMVDGDETVTLSTNLSFEIWNPPPPQYVEPEDEGPVDTGNNETGGGPGELGVGGVAIPTNVVIGLGAILLLSIVILMVTKKKQPKRPIRPTTPTLYQR